MREFGPCSRGATQSLPDSESATRPRKYLCNSADVVTFPSELNVQLHRPLARLTLADGDERRRHWGTLTAMARMLAPDALFASWGALGCVRAPCFARDVASTWAGESGCTAISAFSAHRPRTSPNIYAYFLENSTRTIAFPCLRLPKSVHGPEDSDDALDYKGQLERDGPSTHRRVDAPWAGRT
ncbi:uncharacterized protein SCHCODRAFT_02263728 [Schizophyllum commune H4-8]|uniref:uncharacterized protein n=1 Tax=Schizophyllum commune (strain H4-8 / FGSC 9210) TaxID=578458 RepID=UPI002160F68B|nr:uncharacterized protein SCHCODRAFT_02263728 [Schizophyllum commune H4-8]KAI5893898.1 hypothetical protein SCHCODRAFT_02263728 [Schizophyllum commune H4-8]